MKVFHARGFLNGRKVKPNNYPRQYDGKQLDELTLLATITSREEVKAVIKYLELHLWCFEKEFEFDTKQELEQL